MPLSVVYTPDTGHVLGALALTGAEAPATDPAALVGPVLPLRVLLGAGRTATLPIDARNLAVAAVDAEPGAFDEPSAFAVEQGSGSGSGSGSGPKPALLRLQAWKGGILLTTRDLTVTLPAPLPSTARLTALVCDDQDTHVLAGEIPAGRNEVKLPVTLAEDTPYGVLVLVSGWAGRLERVRSGRAEPERTAGT